MSDFDQRNQKVERQINADKVSIGVTPIICPKCQYENEPKSKFCSECGTSLTFKCPVCETECYLGAKFCSGCGNEINKLQARIKEAQSKRGEERELVYYYKEKPIDRFNIFELASLERRASRVTLDIDEYVVKQEDGVKVYKGNSYQEEAVGCLYLTNKRLLLLGCEPKWQIQSIEWSYPLNEITDVGSATENVLFMSLSYLKILYIGKIRRFSVKEGRIQSWVGSIRERLHGNAFVDKQEEEKGLFPCPKCNLPYQTEKGLKEHMEKWHKTG